MTIHLLHAAYLHVTISSSAQQTNSVDYSIPDEVPSQCFLREQLSESSLQTRVIVPLKECRQCRVWWIDTNRDEQQTRAYSAFFAEQALDLLGD